MKNIIFIIFLNLLISCSSNTIYEKPNDLIPKDTMVAFLTDMYIASSAKELKNKLQKKEPSYIFLIFDKYKIDTTRFDKSNKYYTSRVDEYSEILKQVKNNIDSLNTLYRNKKRARDSVKVKPNDILKTKIPIIERSKDTVKPKDLIPKDTMIDIMKYVQHFQKKMEVKKPNKLIKNRIYYFDSIQSKYKIDSLRLDKSRKYYMTQKDLFTEMLKETNKSKDSLRERKDKK